MNKLKLLALTLLATTFLALPPLHAQLAAPEQSGGGAPGQFAAPVPDQSLAAPQPGVGGSTLPADPSSILNPPSSTPVDPGVFPPLIDGLLGKYGWLTTVLLAIGALRILFKPVMLVVENTVKNDPAKLDAIQKFEAGPIYKTIATVLDVGASIKLPLVKPPTPKS